MTTDYHSIISVDPKIRSGKPVIRGTRITVYDVLSYLALGMGHQEIIEEFPPLTEKAILACPSFGVHYIRPKVIWLHIGNTSVIECETALRRHHLAIVSFLEMPNSRLLSIECNGS